MRIDLAVTNHGKISGTNTPVSQNITKDVFDKLKTGFEPNHSRSEPLETLTTFLGHLSFTVRIFP